MSKLKAELLTALEDFRRIADILGQHEPILDTKSFYYSLFAQCFQLHRQITEITHTAAFSDFLGDKLSRLESLIVPEYLQPYIIRGETSCPYPSLVALHQFVNSEHHNQDGMNKILKECINFGTKDEQEALVLLLKDGNTYLKAQTATPAVLQDVGLFIPLKKRQRPPDGIWPAANSLFKVLDSRKRCTCDPAHKYVVQLCLETHRAKLVNCDFDLYLGLGQVWQEARVQTTTISSSKLPAIVVDGPNPAAVGNGSRCRSKRERMVEKLCGDIIKITSKLPHYRLRYRLEKDSLWKLQSEESNFKIDKSKPPMSLAKIITEKSNMLNEKTKRILSVLLGYAVFHLHGTPWLQSPWSSSNVLFFRSPSGVPLRPYVETHLDDNLNRNPLERTPSDDDDFDPDDDLSPPYPCLVDLAVVLIELHKARSLESLADTYGVPMTEEMDSTARYIFVREVFKSCREDITDQTRMAINSCLDPNIGLNDDGEELDEYGLRGVIYQQIVRRLEDELEQGFSDLSVDRLDTLVQNMDLATGGQPIRLEQLRHSLDVTDYSSKPKRRLSNDNAGRRVRFLTSTDAEASEQPSLSTPRLSTSACGGGSTFLCEKELPSNSTSNHRQNGDLAGRIKQLLATPRERPNRLDTIRVLNIPDEILEHELRTELEKLFDSTCKVHSLARTTRDTHWRKYATVTFPGMANDKLKTLITTEETRLRGSLNLQYDAHFLGITSLYDAGDEAMVDIIAIEGLGTNPFGTFRCPQGDEMWLRDYLPDNFQYCRILLYGYDSKVPGSRSDQSIREIAGTCKNVILDFRKLTKTENRPVIWIGQSMGGLIVQEVLSQSRQHRSFNLPGNLLTCSLGFLGYGVPTNGLKNDSLLEVVRGQPNFEMIKSICIEDNRASHYLNDLAKRFSLCEDSLSIYYFYETNPSDDLLDARAPARRRVDDPEAVDRENTYWIPRNHSELVKISSRSDYTYMITTQVISIILNSTRSN